MQSTKCRIPALWALLLASSLLVSPLICNQEPDPNSDNQLIINQGEEAVLQTGADLLIQSQICLKDSITESDFITDKLPTSLKDKFLLDPEDYKTMDLQPLYNALEQNSMIAFTKFGNSRNFGAIISFLVIFVIFSVFILVHVICGNQKKFILVRKCCFVIISIFTCLLAFICLVMYVGTWPISVKAQRSKDKLTCEATRIPLTILQGNPEIQFDIKHQTHFLGLENLRRWTDSFLLHFEGFVDGKERIALDKIMGIDLEGEVEHLKRVEDKFYINFKGSTVPNQIGQEEVPNSISNGLELYHSKMSALITVYETHAGKINSLTDISGIVNNSTKSEDLKKGLQAMRNETLQMESDLVIFWNKTMDSIIKHSRYTFKIAVVLQAILTFVLLGFIGFLVVYFCCCARGKCVKQISFLRLSGFIIGILLLVVLGLSLELSRTVYTIHYGCGFAYQMKMENMTEFNKMIKATNAPVKVQRIGQHCLFANTTPLPLEGTPADDSTTPTGTPPTTPTDTTTPMATPEPSKQSLFQLFDSSEAQGSITTMLNFLNGLKMTSDDSNLMDRDKDIFDTNGYLNLLKSLKTGVLVDLQPVHDLLIQLNDTFSCSNTFYAFSQEACSSIQTNRSNCLEIIKDPFYPEACIGDSTQSRNDFNHLLKYFQRDETLVADIIQDIESKSHSGSITARLESIWDKNDFVIQTIRSMESELVQNFKGLGDGDLFKWLDCSVIKQDIALIYDDVCVGILMDSMAFVDLLLTLTTFSCLLLFLAYLLTLFKVKVAYSDDRHNQIEEEEDEDEENKGYVGDSGQFDTLQDEGADREEQQKQGLGYSNDNPYFNQDQGENVVFKKDTENQKLDKGFYKAAF